MRREPLLLLLPGGAERRTFTFLNNQVIDRQILSIRLEPAQHGADVVVTLLWFDGTKQRVFEKPVELKRWFVAQKIGELEFCGETGGLGLLRGQPDRTRCDVTAESVETRLRPGANVMARAATGHTNCSTRQAGMRRQEIHQPRRRCALFPIHFPGLITRFPVVLAHIFLFVLLLVLVIVIGIMEF